jgi:hypothetical protein
LKFVRKLSVERHEQQYSSGRRRSTGIIFHPGLYVKRFVDEVEGKQVNDIDERICERVALSFPLLW